MSVRDIHKMPVEEALDPARRIADAEMPVEEALDLARRIADAEDPDCDDLLFADGPEVCAALRGEVLRLAARAADNVVDGVWWRGLDRAVENLTAQRDAAVARVETSDRERDAARAALRDASRCEACGAWATRYHTASARYGCDSCGVGDGWADDTHAAALRAARVP